MHPTPSSRTLIAATALAAPPALRSAAAQHVPPRPAQVRIVAA